MKTLTILALALFTGAAGAAAQPPKASGTASATPPASPQVRFPGVSDAGNAILGKAQTTPDPELQGLGRQLRNVRDQLTSAVMAPTIDVDKVGGILHQQDVVQSQIRELQTEHWVATIKQLSPDDRAIVLRTLLLARPRAAPATQPSSNPQP